jgi:peptide/nickel transport system substrate-binding protein
VACSSTDSGSTGSSRASRATTQAGPYRLGRLEAPEIVTDPSRFPSRFHEAPQLAELVKAGKLPPVDQRIGQDPLIIHPVHEVGSYGEELVRGIETLDTPNPEYFAAGPTSLTFTEILKDNRVVPYIARAYEFSDDGRTLTVELRRGMRWSDGEPFTADDIVFWYEDIYRNPDIGIYPDPFWQIDGKDVTVEKVDDVTVRYLAAAPYYLLADVFTLLDQRMGRDGGGGYAPKHYLQQFHPKYADRGSVGADWALTFLEKSDWLVNPDLPVLAPWKIVQGSDVNSQHLTMERNPYSIFVDTDGNQLPYVHRVRYLESGDAESLNLSAMAGEYDFQDRSLDMSKLPLLLENQERGDYEVHLDPSSTVDFGIKTNLSYHDDEEIGDLLRTADFRRALSLGIDRDQINDAFFLGAGTPSSMTPGPTTKYFPGNKWVTKWATHDPDKANALLDDLGLTKESDGYRRRRDGKGRLRLNYTSPTPSHADYVAMGEMLKEQWREIGIDLDVEGVTGTLIVQKALANQLQLAGHIVGDIDLFTGPDACFPSTTTSFPATNGILYARWFRSNGADGEEPFDDLKELMELWREGFEASEEERVEIGKRWWQQAVDVCLQIGCISQTLAGDGIHLARANMGNIPGRRSMPLESMPFTYYFMS